MGRKLSWALLSMKEEADAILKSDLDFADEIALTSNEIQQAQLLLCRVDD